MSGKKIDSRRIESALREYALGFPESYEEFPWGERAFKVKGKVFTFMYAEPGRISMTVKLPASREFAVMFPFAEPSGYGLGKSGWVTTRLQQGVTAPLSLLKAWIDESYRAIAPKALVARLDGPASGERGGTRRTKKARGRRPAGR